MAITNMQWGLMSLFTFFVGMLASVFAIQWVLGSMAMLLIATSLVFVLYSSRIRKID